MSAREDPSGKERRCRAIHRAIAAIGDRMKTAKSHAAAWQPVINLRHAKGQITARNPASGLNPADLFPKGFHLGGGN